MRLKSGLLATPIEEVLGNPKYFPVHIDFDLDRLLVAETSRARLASTPFLDGRTAIAEGSLIEVSLSEALASKWDIPPGPDRFIFHVAFCGSTLLSTLLEVPGRSFSLREPHVLLELANSTVSVPAALHQSTLDLARALLRRPWRVGERNLCKPSNWANNLIPALTKLPGKIRPVFLVTDERDYLHALFRGGRERFEFIVRATDHLLKHFENGAQLWQRATSGPCQPLEQVARLALTCHHVQLQFFEEAMRHGGWGRSHVLTLAEIEADPLQASLFASEALELDNSASELQATITERVQRYAKYPALTYSTKERRAQNEEIERTHGQLFDRALNWAALSGIDSSRLIESKCALG